MCDNLSSLFDFVLPGKYFRVACFSLLLAFSMLLQKLCSIGFSENEAKVYLGLLKLGPQAVSIIAKKTALSRSTTYSILKSLEKKSVVSSYINANVKYYTASDPNALVGYLDRQCRTFEYQRSKMVSLIPKFREILNEFEYKRPVVRYFEGVEGVKHVLSDALNTKGVVMAYVTVGKWLELGFKDFLLEYKDVRISEKRLKLKAIVPDTKEVRSFFEGNYSFGCGMTELLYVPSDVGSGIFNNEIRICDDRVGLLHLDNGNDYGVIIQCDAIARVHRLMFEKSWKGFSLEDGVEHKMY